MCISVDLPEPEGPITAVSLPFVDPERDAAQRVDCGVAFAVPARDVVGDDDRARVSVLHLDLPGR